MDVGGARCGYCGVVVGVSVCIYVVGVCDISVDDCGVTIEYVVSCVVDGGVGGDGDAGGDVDGVDGGVGVGGIGVVAGVDGDAVVIDCVVVAVDVDDASG